jgi:adenosylmethionine-8-amino-7-oxononanoate aminotransferase
MIWAFEVDTGIEHFSQHFFQAGLQQRLLLRPLGKTVYFMPPYIISDAEIDLLVDGTMHILNSLNE